MSKFNLGLIVSILLVSCNGSLTNEDKAFIEKNCRGESCYMDFEKTNSPSNQCDGWWTSSECLNKERPIGSGPSTGGNGNGNGSGSGQSGGGSGSSEPIPSIGDPGSGIDSGDFDDPNQIGTTQGESGGNFIRGLGDFLSAMGQGVGEAWDKLKNELNGNNAEARRRAKEAKRIINEARDLWSQAESYGKLIENDVSALGANQNRLMDSYNESGLATRDQDLASFRSRYNTQTRSILGEVPEADPSVFDGLGRGLGEGIYPEYRKVEQGRNYVKYARERISGDPSSVDYKAKTALVDFGDAALDRAEESFRAGDVIEGNAYVELGVAAIDVALSLTPGVGWGKDIYEAISGQNLVTGKKLTNIERTFAAIGAITGGLGSKLAVAGKAGVLLGVAKAGAKNADEVAEATKAISQAEKALNNASEAVQAMGLKKFDEVLRIPKGSRPSPENYLPKAYIERHLAKFEDGATRFMSKSNLERFGPAQIDGTAFILPKREANSLLASTNGSRSLFEDALGLPKGSLENTEFVRVDIAKPQDLNLRVPSGNEAGANSLWMPGGLLPNGNSEAVIDLGKAPASSWTVAPIVLK